MAEKQQTPMRLAEVLENWRWAQRLSLKEAAELIGINPPALDRFEKGADITGANMSKIFVFLMAPHEQRPPAKEPKQLDIRDALPEAMDRVNQEGAAGDGEAN